MCCMPMRLKVNMRAWLMAARHSARTCAWLAWKSMHAARQYARTRTMYGMLWWVICLPSTSHPPSASPRSAFSDHLRCLLAEFSSSMSPIVARLRRSSAVTRGRPFWSDGGSREMLSAKMSEPTSLLYPTAPSSIVLEVLAMSSRARSGLGYTTVSDIDSNKETKFSKHTFLFDSKSCIARVNDASMPRMFPSHMSIEPCANSKCAMVSIWSMTWSSSSSSLALVLLVALVALVPRSRSRSRACRRRACFMATALIRRPNGVAWECARPIRESPNMCMGEPGDESAMLTPCSLRKYR
mmetsp:Transcript_18755/g.46692  ORF Transcript_18755/g.46692 Transcript_18755/m.46692 type:complete len:297 (-) Transcript_18755:2186-3076(-)